MYALCYQNSPLLRINLLKTNSTA
nr:unnamed protein product [Callosobruchus analis]